MEAAAAVEAFLGGIVYIVVVGLMDNRKSIDSLREEQVRCVKGAKLEVKRSKMGEREGRGGRGSRGARAIYKVTRVDTRSTLGFFFPRSCPPNPGPRNLRSFFTLVFYATLLLACTFFSLAFSPEIWKKWKPFVFCALACVSVLVPDSCPGPSKYLTLDASWVHGTYDFTTSYLIKGIYFLRTT